MAETFFEAIHEILSVQRWNFLPRIDEWSEAENIAYYTHIAYALSKAAKFSDNETLEIIYRCLLKSFNKHYLSDIPIKTRDAIKRQDEDAWENIITDAAEFTANFFPRELRKDVIKYMGYKSSYNGQKAELFEEIIKFCQYQSAQEECHYNESIFPENYICTKKEIANKFATLTNLQYLKGLFEPMRNYINSIRLLKYVRRWNRLNRNMESTVMAHIFVVSMLAFFFSSLEGKNQAFRHQCIVRALFHDVPESITGDIIAPVKKIINKKDSTFWNTVENSMIAVFKDNAPSFIQEEIDKYDLLSPFPKQDLGSVASLVNECDKFALVLECGFEKGSGNNPVEMKRAFSNYIDDLRNSEWPRIREYASIVFDVYF